MTKQESENSIKEIWALFKTTDKKFEKAEKMFEETAMMIKNTDKKFEKTEKMVEETAMMIKNTDKKFEKAEKMFEETAMMIKNTDKKFENREKEIENVGKRVDALTSKWGRFVEGLIAPAVESCFKEWGIVVDKVFQRVKTHKNGHSMEIDIMAVNGEYVILIEAKSSLKVEDVKEHIKHIGEFKEFFPEYRDKKVVGVVAGIVIDERSDRYAYAQGLFVIGQSGDSVEIINDKKFQPKIW